MKKLCSIILLLISSLSFAGNQTNLVVLPPPNVHAEGEIYKEYSAHVRQVIPNKTNLFVEINSQWSTPKFGPVRIDRQQDEWYYRYIMVHGHPKTLQLTTGDVMPSGRFYFVSNYTYKTSGGWQNTIRVYNYSSKVP